MQVKSLQWWVASTSTLHISKSLWMERDVSTTGECLAVSHTRRKTTALRKSRWQLLRWRMGMMERVSDCFKPSASSSHRVQPMLSTSLQRILLNNMQQHASVFHVYLYFSLRFCNCFPIFKVDKDGLEPDESPGEEEIVMMEAISDATPLENIEEGGNADDAADAEESNMPNYSSMSDTANVESDEKSISNQDQSIPPAISNEEAELTDVTGDINTNDIIEVDLSEEQFVVHVDESDTNLDYDLGDKPEERDAPTPTKDESMDVYSEGVQANESAAAEKGSGDDVKKTTTMKSDQVSSTRLVTAYVGAPVGCLCPFLLSV